MPKFFYPYLNYRCLIQGEPDVEANMFCQFMVLHDTISYLLQIFVLWL
jgi:hypothetical protein